VDHVVLDDVGDLRCVTNEGGDDLVALRDALHSGAGRTGRESVGWHPLFMLGAVPLRAPTSGREKLIGDEEVPRIPVEPWAAGLDLRFGCFDGGASRS
jgi:hypothetical protein